MKIRIPDPTDNPIQGEHDSLGIPPVRAAIVDPAPERGLRTAAAFTILALGGISLFLLGRLLAEHSVGGALDLVSATLNSNAFWTAVAVGLTAQAIDGALGMAYGVTATTFLLGTGVSPAVATASVHMAEVFTTGVSGLSHLRFGNVNRRLFLSLLVPGIIGAVLGAIVITQVDGAIMKPFVSAYLLGIGGYILWRAFRRRAAVAPEPRRVGRLALVGGFVDAAGGGGWGPVVTSTLVGSGQDPRTTIGSVNFAEFFLTLASAATFALLIGENTWPIIAGLVVGGVFAAPFAAALCRKLQARTLMLLVGTLIALVSLFNLGRAFLA